MAGAGKMKSILIFFIKSYQILLSPLLGNYKCRFSPTCSNYMIQAIEKKGLIKGFFLGVCRLLKCQPFSKKSGFDPVE
jgi:putative membrane protein insertion efficiency factor